MYTELRGEKVRLSLNERSDQHVLPLIAQHVGWFAGKWMGWRAAAWDRDLADRPLKVTIPADEVPELSEKVAARRIELVHLMLNQQPGTEELAALCSAADAIAEVAWQTEPVREVGIKQRLGAYALSFLNRSVAS